MEIQMKMIAVVGLISLVGQWGHAWLITLRLSLLDNVVGTWPSRQGNRIMVPMPPGKFLKVLEFLPLFKGL